MFTVTGSGIGAAGIVARRPRTSITGAVPSASAISGTSRANQMFFARSGGLVKRSVSLRPGERCPRRRSARGGAGASFVGDRHEAAVEQDAPAVGERAAARSPGSRRRAPGPEV